MSHGQRALLLLCIVAVTAVTYLRGYRIYEPALLALALGLLIERDALRFIGWRRSDVRLKAIAGMFALAFGLNVFGKFVLAPIVCAVTGQQHDLSSFDYLRGDWWAVLRMFGYVWAIVATCEELIFRGFLLRYLIDLGEPARRTAVVTAIVLSNAFFGVMHSYQGLPGILLTGILGAIFAAIYLWCGRALLPVMLVHGFFDTVSLLAIATNVDRAIRPFQESISRAFGG